MAIRKKEIAFAQSYFAVQTRKQELIEERISLIERTEARGRLRESEKRLSQNIYERGVDDAGFGRIRSKGDRALFGGFTTQEMKERLGVKTIAHWPISCQRSPIAAKNLAAEMTNYNMEEKRPSGESAITGEHVQNNLSVRDMLGQRGIKPEDLPPCGRYQKLERRVKIGKEAGCTVRKTSGRYRRMRNGLQLFISILSKSNTLPIWKRTFWIHGMNCRRIRLTVLQRKGRYCKMMRSILRFSLQSSQCRQQCFVLLSR